MYTPTMYIHLLCLLLYSFMEWLNLEGIGDKKTMYIYIHITMSCYFTMHVRFFRIPYACRLTLSLKIIKQYDCPRVSWQCSVHIQTIRQNILPVK
jgi:hypothetical protein